MDTRRKRNVESKTRGRPRKSPAAAKEESPTAVGPTTRARSKSPARVVKPKGRLTKKVTESDSSQSSTPKQTSPKIKLSPVKVTKANSKLLNDVSPKKRNVFMDDSGDSEIKAITNKSRLESLRSRITPANGKKSLSELTPTPSESSRRSASALSASVSTKEFSDGEDDESEIQRCKTPDNLLEFGGIWGSILLLLALETVPITLSYVFNGKSSWSLASKHFKTPETYCGAVSGWLFLEIIAGSWIFSIIPIGKKVTLQSETGSITYNFTGLISAFLTVVSIFTLKYFGLNLLGGLYEVDQLLHLSVFYALGLSVVCYLKAKYWSVGQLNPFGKSKRLLVDFFAGVEVNPKAFNRFDIKQIAYHQYVILLLMINLALLNKGIRFPKYLAGEDVIEEDAAVGALTVFLDFFKRGFEEILYLFHNAEYNKLSLLVPGLISIYSLDLLVFEHHLTSSFELSHEGCGAGLLLRYATFPYLLTFISRFVQKQTEINRFALFVICVLFFTGLAVKRLSNKLKYDYRLHPSAAKYKDIITLPTFQGRRLILDSFWSFVRMPNYLGELLIHVALLMPLIFKFDCVSFLGILLIIAYLIHRTVRINDRNFKKYNSSWARYTTEVKYNLVPRIY